MHRENSIRKAAVLVASLDDETADLLLEQMDQEQADAVRREVLELGELDPAEQQAVIDEFFRIGPLVPEADPPGLELDDRLLERLIQPQDLHASSHYRTHDVGTPHDRYASHPTAQAFGFLQDAEPEALVPMLEREHPQAIALVLAHLPPERAGHVLARLPAAIQTDVVRRLVDLEETDPRVLRDVERAVESWLRRRQPSRRRVVGASAVSAILSAAEGRNRRQILNNLAAHDRPLAYRFTPPSPAPCRFTFAELCRLPSEALACVVRNADRRSVVLALAGAPAQIVEELLAYLRADEAEWVSDGLTNLGPMRLADIDSAQDELADLAGQLHAEGRLSGVSVTHMTAVV